MIRGAAPRSRRRRREVLDDLRGPDARHLARRPSSSVLHDCVEQAVLAEEMGFDRVWSVEHHCLKWYAHMSAPETFLAYVAAKTKRIRIGHGVVCLPFRMNHPVKVAERVAMLDILSKGRVDFGIGKGGTLQEAGAFQTDDGGDPGAARGVGPHDPEMWLDDEFEHQSELIDIPRAPDPPEAAPGAAPADVPGVHAREHAEPGRRVGARRARARLRRARGHRAEEPRVPRGGRAAHAGFEMGAFPVEHLSALCPAIVLDDGAKARAIGHRGQRFFTEAIRHWYNPGGDSPPPRPEIADMDDAEVLRAEGEQVVAYLNEQKITAGSETTGLYNPNHAYGTVEARDRATVERLAEAGADEIMFLIQMGTVPQGPRSRRSATSGAACSRTSARAGERNALAAAVRPRVRLAARLRAARGARRSRGGPDGRRGRGAAGDGLRDGRGAAGRVRALHRDRDDRGRRAVRLVAAARSTVRPTRSRSRC